MIIHHVHFIYDQMPRHLTIFDESIPTVAKATRFSCRNRRQWIPSGFSVVTFLSLGSSKSYERKLLPVGLYISIRLIVCINYDAVTSYNSQGSKNETVLLKFGAPSIRWA